MYCNAYQLVLFRKDFIIQLFQFTLFSMNKFDNTFQRKGGGTVTITQ